MNAAIMPVEPTLLENLFDLPVGHHITGVKWSPESQKVCFLVEGPSLPFVPDGAEVAPLMTATFRKKDYELVALDILTEPTHAE